MKPGGSHAGRGLRWMDEDPGEVPTVDPHARRLAARGIMGFAALLVVGLGIAGFFAYERIFDYRPAAAELPAAVTAYRKTGMPWVAADLAPNPPVRPEENAAPLLRRAAEAMIHGKWSKVDVKIRDAVERGDWNAAAKGLLPFLPAMETFEAAAKRPRVDFARDLDLGPNVLFPEYAGMKSGAKAFGVRAQIRAANGDLEGARADLAMIRTLARQAGEEAVLISLLVRIAGETIGENAVQRAAAIDPRLAAGLITDLEKPAPRPDFARTLRGEAYFGISTARNLQGRLSLSDMDKYDAGQFGPVEDDPARVRRDGLPEGQVQRAYMARSLQAWTRADAIIRRYKDDPRGLGIAMDGLSMQEQAQRGKSHVFNQVMFPVFAQCGVAIVKSRANREITLAYLRALEHRRRTGAFPKTLISGKDPFGHPYVARREGKGFRIYSVGLDGKDDGGLTSIERANAGSKSDDIAALYPLAVRKAPATR